MRTSFNVVRFVGANLHWLSELRPTEEVCDGNFGGKNSALFHMIPGELRAHLALAGGFGDASTALSKTIILSTPPTPRKAGQITRATTDSVNPGAALLLRDPTRRYAHSSFVDNTGITQTRDRMVGAITNSILSAYVVFGFPSEDRRTPCLNPFKWSPHVSHQLRFLGYQIDTRAMTVQWPDKRRAQLFSLFDVDWLSPLAGKNSQLTPRQIARPLGLVRHGAFTRAYGVYRSRTWNLAGSSCRKAKNLRRRKRRTNSSTTSMFSNL